MRSKRRKSKGKTGTKLSKDDTMLSNRPFRSQLKNFKRTDDKAEHQKAARPADTMVEKDGSTLFQEAMKGVEPLRDARKKVVRPPSRRDEAPEQSRTKEEKEREYLSALVQDSSAWDISFSDEYMVGAVPGVGPQIMRKLKRGEFSVQDYIDLHGLKKKEAEEVVQEFILKSHQRGLRCVLIVHGRGLRSVDHQPAIKKELPVWFRKGALKRIVLAFVTARPCDGGAGALYVLLKKR